MNEQLKPGDTVRIKDDGIGRCCGGMDFVVRKPPDEIADKWLKTEYKNSPWVKSLADEIVALPQGSYTIVSRGEIRGRGEDNVEVFLKKQRDENLRHAFGY